MGKIRKSFLVILASLFLSAGLLCAESGALVYHTDDKGRKIKGFIAYPEKVSSRKPVPGIILIHEWWGFNEDVVEMALKYAEAGYVALAVDLYAGRNAHTREAAGKLAGEVRGNIDETFRNLKSAISYLKKDPRVDGDKLASVGWCFGGAWSYQMAKNNLGVAASVIYYGRFNPDDDLSIMRSRILGHFADKDRSILLDTVREFQVKLRNLSSEHEIYIYPNTHHGFANNLSNKVYEFPGELQKTGIHDKAAADLSFTRTVAFLRKVLGKS